MEEGLSFGFRVEGVGLRAWDPEFSSCLRLGAGQHLRCNIRALPVEKLFGLMMPY